MTVFQMPPIRAICTSDLRFRPEVEIACVKAFDSFVILTMSF